MTGAPSTPDQAVLEGVIQRLSGELAQARVTVAELDTRLQLQTAATIRAEAERDQAREQLAASPAQPNVEGDG